MAACVPRAEEAQMVLCPGAMAIGCKKCPVVGFCPLKSVIGDFKKEEAGEAKAQAAKPDKQ